MWSDPIVEETRKAREELFARFDYDLEALARHLRERDKRDSQKVVDLPPKAPARSSRKAF